MPYTPPTVTASGATWTQFKSNNGNLISAIQGANPALTQNQLALIGKLTAAPAFQSYQSLISQYLGGQPMSIATVNSNLFDLATAYAVLLEHMNEVATLVYNNPGTIQTILSTTGGPASQRLVLP